MAGHRKVVTPFPGTQEGIHIAIPFDYWVNRGLPYGSHLDLKGKVDYVWGAQPPGTGGSTTLTSAHLEAYLPFGIDFTHHSLRWFQTYHPGWVVYRCNSLGLPTTGPAYYSAHSYVPLDFSNPAVRAFQARYAARQLRKGYDGISVDNFTFTNYAGRCGVYRNREWTSLGYPPEGETNLKLTADMLGWLRYLRSWLRRSDPGRTITVNFSTLLSGSAALPRLLPYVDGVLDEQGFTAAGRRRLTDSRWRAEVDEANLVQASGKAFIAVGYTPGPYASKATQEDEVNWILANYLLVKASHAYTYVEHLTPGYDDLPEYHVRIGHPVSNLYRSQGVEMRLYSGGLAIVNPSSVQSYRVRLGRTYHDTYGAAVSSLALPPATGVVLLKP